MKHELQTLRNKIREIYIIKHQECYQYSPTMVIIRGNTTLGLSVFKPLNKYQCVDNSSPTRLLTYTSQTEVLYIGIGYTIYRKVR